MNAFQKTIYLFLFCGISLSQTVLARGAAVNWKETSSKSFHIIGNADETNIEQTVRKLEDFRRSFFDLFQTSEEKSPIPTRVLIFNSKTDYAAYLNLRDAYLPKNSFHAGQDANYIIIFLDETNFRDIYHQYFHYLLSNHIGKSKIPAWLNEGLAQTFENFQADDVPKSNNQVSEQNKYELLRQKKLLPAENFLNTDYYSLNQQPNHRDGVFYAQAAAIVDYLLEKQGGEKFKRFINLISSGKSLNESLIKSFQTDFTAIEKNLRSFAEEKSVTKNREVQKTASLSLDLKFSPLSESEIGAFLGDFLYQINRLDEAELHLLKSLSLNAFASFPKSTLGLVKLAQLNYDEVFRHLDKSLEYGDASYLIYYRYAFALSRQGITEYGFVSNYNAETAERIRHFLKKAIDLNPDFAESYNVYALVGFVRNEEIDESLVYITKTLKSTPGNDWYLLRKSELEMRKENFTEARKTALKIYQNAPDAGLRLYAQNTVQRIDSTEYQLLNSRRQEKYPYSDAISETPFSDEEIARLRVKAMRESLNAVLRRPSSDEKRILGRIVGIDCRQNQIDFTVDSSDKRLKFSAASFEELYLMTFYAGMTKNEIGCGNLNKDNSAVIIYRKPAVFKPDTAGEIISIEFVPKDFQLPEIN